MRILLVTASLPYPLHSGGAIRTFGLLRGLVDAGHIVSLLSFQEPGQTLEDTPLPEIVADIQTIPPPHRTKVDRLRDMLTTSEADIARRLDSAPMHQTLRRLLKTKSFDIVQFEGIEVAAYLETARLAQPDAYLIYDAFNAEAAMQRDISRIDWQIPQRWPAALYSTVQAGRIEAFERKLCDLADGVIAVSEEDATLLRQLSAKQHIFVVPNGISAKDYSVGDAVQLEQPSLVFTGKMDYRPNVDAMTWFAGQIFPQILVQTNAHLYIVGQRPTPRITAFGAQKNVSITGWVPDIQPYLHGATVYVAPLRMGSGTRLKILEAMAAGCAVVATSTAASGLMADAKQYMTVADQETEIATAVIKLLQQPDVRDSLGRGASGFVRQHYDWSVLVPRLLDAYEELKHEQTKSD